MALTKMTTTNKELLKNSLQSALEQAIDANDLATTLSLLDEGADPNARRSDGVHGLIDLLGSVCRINANNSEDDMPKKVETARLLLSRGASPNYAENENILGYTTPLLFATMYEQVDLVKLLVLFGADVNAKSFNPMGSEMQTPLQYAQTHDVDSPKHQEIIRVLETAADLQNAGKPARKIRVMISYCWANQTKAIALHKTIQAAGFTVWIDIENMSGSTTDAMAEAVDTSDVVLCLISDAYQTSCNCRMEFEYAHGQKKLIIPVKADSSFTPSGWLALQLGKTLYFNFTDENQQEKGFPSIVREICKVSSCQAIDLAAQKRNNSTPAASSFAAWESPDVVKWLNTNGFADCEAAFVNAKMTGKGLLTLKALAQEPARVSLFFDVLKEMGVQPIGRALALASEIKELII